MGQRGKVLELLQYVRVHSLEHLRKYLRTVPSRALLKLPGHAVGHACILQGCCVFDLAPPHRLRLLLAGLERCHVIHAALAAESVAEVLCPACVDIRTTNTTHKYTIRSCCRWRTWGASAARAGCCESLYS